MRLFTRDRSFYRSLITLALPVALQSLITFTVTFADNVMVSTLGDASVSGVYMGSQIQTLIQMCTGGISGAILIISAQYWGKADTARMRCITATGLRVSIAVGLFFTLIGLMFPRQTVAVFTDDAEVINEGTIYLRYVCLSYAFFCVTQALIAAMRSVEVTIMGMFVSIASLLVNISLNYILIFGKFGITPMGVKGAAIATVCARIAETAVIAWYALIKDKKLMFRLKSLLLKEKTLTGDFFRCCLPMVAGDVVWSINMMCNAKILGGYGSGVITAASVANTMNTLAFIMIGGLSSAVGIITGKTIGAGKVELMKEYARTTQVMLFLFGLATGALVFAIRAPYISLYRNISAEAVRQSMLFCGVLSVTIVGTAYQACGLAGLVKAGGDIGFVFKNDTIFVFLVVLPSAFIAARLGAPAWVTFACLKCDQILKCFVAVVKINSFNWMKNLTRGENA